jgi:uncharacterized protein DUF5995
VSRIESVADVVRRLREIDTGLDATDGVAVFNRVYLQVTEMVQERLAGHSTFRDEPFIADLDVRFAGLWFAAHDAPADAVPTVWDPLFESRGDRGVLPIQFALAGMNAHIEHDLPLAVVRTCAGRGLAPTGVREDYERVNDLLAGVEAGIRRSFLDELGKAADHHLGQVAHLVSSWSIDKARDVAWVNVLALWELRGSRVLGEGYGSALARTVGMGSRLLLTSLA